MAGRQVPTAARPAAVRREQPDVVAAAGATLVTMAQDGQGPAVRQPGRPEELGAAAGRDPGHGPVIDVDDVDVAATDEIRVRPPVGGERDPPAVRRPGRLAVARPAVGEAARRAVGCIDEPEVADPVVREALAVEHVLQAVDEPVVGQRDRRLALAGQPAPPAILLARRAMGCADDHQPAPVGRPFEGVDTAREVGQAPGLAAVEGQQVDLVGILAVVRGAGCRIVVLGVRATIGDEGQRPAVGREPRLAIAPRPERQLPRGLRAVGRHDPERLPVAVVARGDRLDGHDRQRAVG